MQKLFLKSAVIALAGVGLIAGSALADPVTLIDETLFTATGTDAPEDYVAHGYGDVNFLDGFFDYVSWFHNFEFDPPAETLLTATLTLEMTDDDGDTWYNPTTWEVGVGFAEGGGWDLGEVDTGEYSYDVNVSLLEDGQFFVTVGSLLGDFYLDSSQLEITYNPAPVPEPATMLLFGTGLAALAGVARRKKK